MSSDSLLGALGAGLRYEGAWKVTGEVGTECPTTATNDSFLHEINKVGMLRKMRQEIKIHTKLQ